MTPTKTTAIHHEPFTTKAGRLLCAALVTLVTACGGGGESTPMSSQPQPQPPAPAYSVVVKTVDTHGQPIAGVSVLLAGVDLIAGTGSDGTATFNFNTRSSGESVIYANQAGYHTAEQTIQLTGAGSPIVQQLTLMRTDELPQLVLRGVTSQASADASSVVVSAEIGDSNRSGTPNPTLTAADFRVPTFDCGWGPCILDPSGAMLNDGWWSPSRTVPVEATLSGTGPSTHYKVRFVLEAVPGMFTAGRTVVTYLDVRVGADTWVGIEFNVPL